MKDYTVYTQIQQLKRQGFKQAYVARTLSIHRQTVKKYWDMPVDDFEMKTYAVNRTKLLENYESIILQWLVDYPAMKAAQICDWLKERCKASFNERTVRRYVKFLREKHNIKKEIIQRDYEAIEDPPMGEQLQLDFGEKRMLSVTGTYIKVRCAAFALSNSRQKYLIFQQHPFRAFELVNALKKCFCFYGGMPREIVIDQDKVMTVSENYGDIIHTYEFEKFKQECKFDVYLCRKSDPESKGRIENVVNYVKGNFLENRIYVDDKILNDDAFKWLDRTGNAKVHGTTHMIPAEVFKKEREFLRPLPDLQVENKPNIQRMVRKDNTILYQSNRYSVPLGTYAT